MSEFESNTLQWCPGCQRVLLAQVTEEERSYLTEGKVMHKAFLDCRGCGIALGEAYHWHEKGKEAS